jgi:hypothetical protein
MQRTVHRRVRAAALIACFAGAVLAVSDAADAQEASLRRHDVVLHYWPGQARLAASLLPQDAGFRFPGLPADVLQRDEPVNVYLAPDAVRWDSLTGGRSPDWGAGLAYPHQGVVIIPGYVSDRAGTHTLPVILRHELAHIALQRTMPGVNIPRWFNEGYATWAAGQFDADAGWMLRLAFVTQRAPPLDSITLDWPLLEADARLAYLLSASAVRYLHSLGTDQTFERFLASAAAHGDFERALREVYILSSPQFERLWRAHVRRSFGWLQIFAQSMFIWLILTLFVLLLFVVRRRRNRARMDVLLRSELPDEPAYWLDRPEDDDSSDDGTAANRGDSDQGGESMDRGDSIDRRSDRSPGSEGA